MPSRIIRPVIWAAALSLLNPLTAIAQEKSALITLDWGAGSDAAKAALVAALEEVENFGGAHRVDAKLKAVIDADPNFAFGRAVYGMWGTLSAAERQTELTRALKDGAGNSAAQVIYITALREWRAGRNAVARDLVDAALKLAPDDRHLAWARINLAANADEAVRLGEAALKQFPDYAPIHNTVAYRLNAQGRKDDAIKVIQKYVSLAPGHPNPHDSYAEILQLNGKYDEAMTHYAKALELDPRFDAAHEGMAEVEVIRGNYAAARPHLTAAMKDVAPARRQVLQRAVAATLLYENKLADARKSLEQTVADAQAAGLNVLPDYRTLALIAALQRNKADAQAFWEKSLPPTPFPTMPVFQVQIHALLKDNAALTQAAAAMEANAAKARNVADVQQANLFTRVVVATTNNDLAAAKTAYQAITGPIFKALSAAYLAPFARKAGDAALAQEAEAVVAAFTPMNMNGGFSRAFLKRK